MTTLLWRALYFLRTATSGLASSPVTTVVAVGTIAVTLGLAGTFALVLKQMSGLLDEVGRDLTVIAWLEPGLAPADRSRLASRVATVEGVAGVAVVSEEEALRRFESAGGDGADLLEGLETNPLPASLEIALAPEWRTSEGIDLVVRSLQGLPGIAELGHGQEWVDTYARVMAGVRGVAVALGGVLALAGLLIVANTIRLAVYARRDEIEILALVGASRSFIGAPFLLEGAIQGALGASLAWSILALVFWGVTASGALGVALVVGWTDPHFFSWGESLALVATGAALGLVGSALALVSAWSQR